MTGGRACALLLALAGIAFTVVWLRGEQTRAAARTLSLESRWIQLRRELWAAQTAVARLRTPHAIRDRLDWFEPSLTPPESGPMRLVVSDQP